jgi:RNA ligase
MNFQPFPKIPRLKREVVITEKLDGTNAQVVIVRSKSHLHLDDGGTSIARSVRQDDNSFLHLLAGSRNKWIQPGKETDNYGFASWAVDNATALFKLGEGQHFGEWYGRGIQRNYGLDTRRFALFNRARYENTPDVGCVEFVPILYTGGIEGVDECLQVLRKQGSTAVPGFMNPEGIVVYHTAARSMFKVLLENDSQPKGQQ